MINKTTLLPSKIIKGQSVETLHAPDCSSVPFFTAKGIALVIVCLVWLPVATDAREDTSHNLATKQQQLRLTSLGLSKVGEGHMKWFGFSLYRASLWTQNGVYLGMPEQQVPDQGVSNGNPVVNGIVNQPDSLPIALHIVYQKNISRETLIDTTVKEWRRLKIADQPQQLRWAQQLRGIWPDVKPGDSITTVMDDNHHTIFLVNGRDAGKVTDVQFGPALLAIWLHPETRAADLRVRLIGQQGG
ncbi:MAG: chalcone isomerase family protein [Gammaproteobacteria bacterium]|nr:chalcone isomerase family protein [Gammaproteobacteria bacterium]